MSILPWLVCPSCENEEFDEGNLQEDKAVCPKCGESTEIQDIDDELSLTETVESSEEETLSDMLVSLKERESKAHDEPEVQDGELVFKHEEEFYRAGTEPFYCPTCGDECELSCENDGRRDLAYCTRCHIKYERSRTELVDDVSTGVSTQTFAEDRDAYEEYDCNHCDELHPYTRPDGTYDEPNPVVGSYERTWFNCPCGNTLSGKFELYQTVNCPNCPRQYTLESTFHDEVSDDFEAF